MVKSLDTTVVDQVYAEMREGYTLLKGGEASAAEPYFLRAWALIPEPKYDWDISQLTVIRMAKFYRDAKMYPQALRWAKDVFRCNPLRGDCQPYVVLGSIHLEAGDTAAALESLQKAYDLAGKRAFQGEDPKYLKFVQAHTKK